MNGQDRQGEGRGACLSAPGSRPSDQAPAGLDAPRVDPSRGAFAFGDDEWPGIAKLNEECGEVIQVIGKLMMTHGNPAHWSGNLRAMLVDEMGDVLAAIGFVSAYCLTEEEETAMARRTEDKWVKFEGWHDDFDADPPPELTPTESPSP